ncbi:MAG TPA: ATP-binding cassette domain-containing protein [Gemmatimonadales bacterium]|nr:ATP-binding cassette domain-containing protein [Gemmatimonadales bacterium]
MSDPILSLDRVVKRYAGHTAVRELSFDVPRGGIFGLLGPNGAGKTTTIRMIMHITVPDAGRITLFGEPASRALAPRVGYLPEERGLYPKMGVLEQLVFLGETRGLAAREARRRAAGWLERVGLADWTGRKVQDLSKGMQQKVQFVGALLHDPELVVLDEPFSGLDPVNSQVMKDVVVDLAREGRTVVFSTHIMEQAERMCDRVVIIARGEKVVDGRLADVKREGGGRHVALVFRQGRERAAAVLADRTLVARADDYGASAEVELAPAGDPDRLLRALVEAGVGLARFEVVEPSLQSIFIARVGAGAAVAPASEDGRSAAHAREAAHA